MIHLNLSHRALSKNNQQLDLQMKTIIPRSAETNQRKPQGLTLMMKNSAEPKDIQVTMI